MTIENCKMFQFFAVPPHLSSSSLLFRRLTLFTGRSLYVGLLTILLTGCPKDPQPDPWDTSIFLELEKTWTTSVTLKVSVADTSDNWNFSLSRDDTSVGSYIVTGEDTLIVDGGLEPDREYRYRAYWLDDGLVRDSSNAVIAVTMDTTSHNFTWEIDTLGNYGSYLNDVAIVDENNIWVVGNIETDSCTFNAARWDGGEWEMINIDLHQPFFSVFAFESSDVWATSGIPHHWDGESWEKFHLWNMGILDEDDGILTAIWGTSSSNLYFAGKSSTIVHYDGTTFTKVESGMDIPIVNIWGIADNEVYFCQFDNTTGFSGILYYNGMQIETLYYFESISNNSDILYGAIHAIWATGDTLYAACSSGIWKESISLKIGRMTRWTEIFSEQIYPNMIKGLSYNDIFIIGNWMKVAHFNGVSWQSYTDLFGDIGTYEAIDLKGDLVCAVGWTDFPQAFIVVGNRVVE